MTEINDIKYLDKTELLDFHRQYLILKMAICCPWMSRRHRHYDDIDETDSAVNRRGPTESSSLLKNGHISKGFSARTESLVDAYIASYRSWEDDINLWSDPYDITHTRVSQDRELDGLIRDWRKAATEIEKKAIYEKMQVIRLQRKYVQNRWRKVLEKLGFTSEIDQLVSISSASGITQPEPPSDQALNLHQVLVYQTDLFSDAEVHDRRYGIVLDRLIAVDVADDFVAIAKQMYPKEPDEI